MALTNHQPPTETFIYFLILLPPDDNSFQSYGRPEGDVRHHGALTTPSIWLPIATALAGTEASASAQGKPYRPNREGWEPGMVRSVPLLDFSTRSWVANS
jgi:hypothetical protein